MGFDSSYFSFVISVFIRHPLRLKIAVLLSRSKQTSGWYNETPNQLFLGLKLGNTGSLNPTNNICSTIFILSQFSKPVNTFNVCIVKAPVTSRRLERYP